MEVPEQKLFNLDGTVAKTIMDNKEVELTLKTICVQAVINSADNAKEPMSVQKKLEYYDLATKINKGGTIDLTQEEIVSIKERVGETPNILIVGQCYQLLEGKKLAK